MTAQPTTIVDEDIASLRRYYRDPQVAEIVLHIANAALFNRVTEACGLRLEDPEGTP